LRSQRVDDRMDHAVRHRDEGLTRAGAPRPDGFTQGRLGIWNRTLDPKTYELREQGSEPRRQKAMLFLLLRLPMNRVISRMWASALDRYALSQDG
jgi:hypothetical protein